MTSYHNILYFIVFLITNLSRCLTWNHKSNKTTRKKYAGNKKKNHPLKTTDPWLWVKIYTKKKELWLLYSCTWRWSWIYLNAKSIITIYQPFCSLEAFFRHKRRLFVVVVLYFFWGGHSVESVKREDAFKDWDFLMLLAPIKSHSIYTRCTRISSIDFKRLLIWLILAHKFIWL